MFRRAAALAAACLGLIVSASLRADEVVRIMAANITSGSGQAYEAPGNRIFQGLDPDIALVQEMNVGTKTPAVYRAWVDANFGSTFSYYVETGKPIPNGIVSRYPIVSSGYWEDVEIAEREFAWARIQVPGDKFLWAISVHLKSGSTTAEREERARQAIALKNYIISQVPAGDHIVIGGDCNTYSRTEDCVNTLGSVVKVTAPWPKDQANNTNTNAGQSSPYDWVMPSNSLAAFATPLVIGPNTHTDGLVFDSRDYEPLSAVSPILEADSGATGMQHMAVMRAFLIPTNDPPVIAQADPVAVTLSKNNTPTAFSRSLSATDPENDTLTWSIQTQAGHGTAGIVAPATGGTVNLSYTPVANYTGTDSFVVRVSDGQGGTDSITVNLTVQEPPNTAPVITQGTSVSVALSKNNTPTAFSRSLNATDANGDGLAWMISTQAAHGTAGIVAPASGGTVNLSYTPVTNYTGSDSFVVHVSDGRGGTDTITVNLTIQEPPNTAPVIAGAETRSLVISQNGYPAPFQLTLQASDADADPLAWSVSVPAAHGTASVEASAGSAAIHYQPTAGFTGSDGFTVQVADGRGGIDSVSVQVTVQAAAAYDAWTYAAFAPLTPETEAAVWGEDADPDGDGFSNLEEFAHGLNPQLSDGAPNLVQLAYAGDGEERQATLTLKLRLQDAAPALDYTLLTTADPGTPWSEVVPGDYTLLGETDLGGGFIARTIRITRGTDDAARCFRLVYAAPE